MIAGLGGAGTLLGPVLGAGIIKYFENIFSAYNEQVLERVFDFLPDGIDHAVASVAGLFVGEGWHLTLGLVFMLIVIFLPGGVMEGFTRLRTKFSKPTVESSSSSSTTSPAKDSA